jgi:manganese-dependent ADP-ribose/CDP-alcohol diphosphatase
MLRIARLTAAILVLAVWVARAAEPEKPLFAFGLVTDIQYADKATAGTRRYGESVAKLSRAVEEWNRQDVAFVVEMGDITDDREADTAKDLAKVLEVFKALRAPLYHVLGNHGLFSLGRERILKDLGLAKPYYSFAQKGWRFVVLDGMGLSLAGWPVGSDQVKDAKAYLMENKGPGRPELVQWNGAIDEEQKKWLAETLAQAVKDAERVVVFCHHPTLEGAASKGSLLWNHAEIVKMVEGCPAVVAYLAGHEHRGGYACHDGVHHVTVQGLVEAPADGNAFAVVAVFPEKLVITGNGTVTSRTLEARKVPVAAAPQQ